MLAKYVPRAAIFTAPPGWLRRRSSICEMVYGCKAFQSQHRLQVAAIEVGDAQAQGQGPWA